MDEMLEMADNVVSFNRHSQPQELPEADDFELLVLLAAFSEEQRDFILDRARQCQVHPQEIVSAMADSYMKVCEAHDAGVTLFGQAKDSHYLYPTSLGGSQPPQDAA